MDTSESVRVMTPKTQKPLVFVLFTYNFNFAALMNFVAVLEALGYDLDIAIQYNVFMLHQRKLAEQFNHGVSYYHNEFKVLPQHIHSITRSRPLVLLNEVLVYADQPADWLMLTENYLYDLSLIQKAVSADIYVYQSANIQLLCISRNESSGQESRYRTNAQDSRETASGRNEYMQSVVKYFLTNEREVVVVSQWSISQLVINQLLALESHKHVLLYRVNQMYNTRISHIYELALLLIYRDYPAQKKIIRTFRDAVLSGELDSALTPFILKQIKQHSPHVKQFTITHIKNYPHILTDKKQIIHFDP